VAPKPVTRRELVLGAVATTLALTAGAKERTMTASHRMPTLFVAHGAPPLLDMPDWVGQLKQWGDALGKPKAILMVSAHWEERPATLGATKTVPLVYDFYGFPEQYYRQQYASPGAPALATRIEALLPKQTARDERRGLDHGAYVPLVAMYPDADVPVLQLSLPSEDPKALFSLGQALAPLRDEGVLIIGSGFITHNMRAIDWTGRSKPPSWASEFDAWTGAALERHDVDGLMQYMDKPGAKVSLPTQEHFVPLLVALGAASADPVRFPITGFFAGSFTKRSVQFG
jgi:4,5-DOPA dioxygenase extradiol